MPPDETPDVTNDPSFEEMQQSGLIGDQGSSPGAGAQQPTPVPQNPAPLAQPVTPDWMQPHPERIAANKTADAALPMPPPPPVDAKTQLLRLDEALSKGQISKETYDKAVAYVQAPPAPASPSPPQPVSPPPVVQTPSGLRVTAQHVDNLHKAGIITDYGRGLLHGSGGDPNVLLAGHGYDVPPGGQPGGGQPAAPQPAPAVGGQPSGGPQVAPPAPQPTKPVQPTGAPAPGANPYVGRTANETERNIANAQDKADQNEANADIEALDQEQRDINKQNEIKTSGRAAAITKRQQETADWEAKYTQMQADNQARWEALSQQNKQLMAQKVDPNHFWTSMSAGKRVLTGIALALSTFGSSLTHTENMVQKEIDQGIQDDVNAQMEDIKNRREGLIEEGQSLQQRQASAAADMATRYQLIGDAYQTAIDQADNMAAAISDPKAKQAAATLQANLVKKQQLAGLAGAQVTLSQQRSAEGAAAAAAKHRQDQAEEIAKEQRAHGYKVSEIGAQGQATIDVNAAKTQGQAQGGPAGNLKAAVDDYRGYADKNGDYPDTNIVTRNLPVEALPERVKAARNSFDNVVMLGARKMGIRVSDPAKIPALKKQFFGTETPTNDQKRAFVTRMENLSKVPDRPSGGGGGDEAPGDTGEQ